MERYKTYTSPAGQQETQRFPSKQPELPWHAYLKVDRLAKMRYHAVRRIERFQFGRGESVQVVQRQVQVHGVFRRGGGTAGTILQVPILPSLLLLLLLRNINETATETATADTIACNASFSYGGKGVR